MPILRFFITHILNFNYLLLISRGYAFNSTADFELVRNIKESLCYVSSDINVDRKLANETTSIEKEY